MNQLEIRSSTTYRAEIFIRSVSHQDHSSLKILVQKDHSKWEIVCEHSSNSVGGQLPSDIHFYGHFASMEVAERTDECMKEGRIVE